MIRQALIKNPLSKDLDHGYYQSAKDWYGERYECLSLSLNRYRLLSLLLALLLGLCLTAFIIVLPLNKTVYRLIAVNEKTGEVTTLKETVPQQINKNWNVTRYFIHQYVIDRHAYSYDDIKRTFNIALAMSAKPIADDYAAEILDTNPESPLNTLNKKAYRDVKIASINALNDNTALVRFQTITRNRNTTNDIERHDFEAVLKWNYQMPSKDILEHDNNPLGFFVTYYKVTPVFTEKN